VCSSDLGGGYYAQPVTSTNPNKPFQAFRSPAMFIGLAVLLVLTLGCIVSLPWTLGSPSDTPEPRYNVSDLDAYLLPPNYAIPADESSDERARHDALEGDHFFLMGTDNLGRDLFVRCLAGGGISIGIGLAAAAIAVTIGTLYGSIAAVAGGKVDAVMMRIVDILYGLPYVLLVVLLAVTGDTLLDEYISQNGARTAYIEQLATEHLEETGVPIMGSTVSRLLEKSPELESRFFDEAQAKYPARDVSQGERSTYEVIVLLIAIGGVSWLTMARVIRGQVLSLKAQPFMEAARATAIPVHMQFVRHLLPNLIGPVIVYATLTVPQAILQESFLSFLGIGVQPPLPSWGNLAADGLSELNPVRIRWWLIVFPCSLLAVTLLALNFVGEGLRESFDPKRSAS